MFHSVEEQLGRSLDDRVHIQPILAVKVMKITGLAEAVDAQRADAVPHHAAEP